MSGPLARGFALGALALVLWPATGRAGDGRVAVQSAEPSCGDDSGDVYVDCLNGTVTDNRTGLVWLQDADCFGPVDWHTAMGLVAGLADIPDSSDAAVSDCDLSDGSSPGEWRLPSARELERMVADSNGDPGELDCVLGITNDQGNACWTHGCHSAGFCSFKNVAIRAWSSTTFLGTATGLPFASAAFFLESDAAYINHKTTEYAAWPVRGGQ